MHDHHRSGLPVQAILEDPDEHGDDSAREEYFHAQASTSSQPAPIQLESEHAHTEALVPQYKAGMGAKEELGELASQNMSWPPPSEGFISHATWIPPDPPFVSYAEGLYAQNASSDAIFTSTENLLPASMLDKRQSEDGECSGMLPSTGQAQLRDASPQMRRSASSASLAAKSSHLT